MFARRVHEPAQENRTRESVLWMVRGEEADTSLNAERIIESFALRSGNRQQSNDRNLWMSLGEVA